jgi:dihydrofolate reductase
MKPFKAIAAMSLNRVLGYQGRIPWRLPEDFKWFKQMTTGHILVMGRRTFESLGKPLPHRTTVVLSRSGFSYPGIQVIQDLQQIDRDRVTQEVFICGGAEVYRQALPHCSDLYLTEVQRIVTGDTFFPRFEDDFHRVAVLRECPEFRIIHYRNLRLINENTAEPLMDAGSSNADESLGRDS